MAEKRKIAWTGTLVAASCLVLGVASYVSAEPSKGKNTSISEEEVLTIVLNHAELQEEEVSRLRTEQDRDDNRIVYEIEFETDEREYEYEVNAEDGTILKAKFEIHENLMKRQDMEAEKITEEDAKKIVLEMVEGAQEDDLHIYEDRDDNRRTYEGKIIYEKILYEFEMDAVSGEILTWEQEAVFE